MIMMKAMEGLCAFTSRMKSMPEPSGSMRSHSTTSGSCRWMAVCASSSDAPPASACSVRVARMTVGATLPNAMRGVSLACPEPVDGATAAITIVPGNAADHTTAVTVVLSEPGTFTCALDGAPLACADSFTLLPPAEGQHALTVTAADPLGNSGDTSATFLADWTAPVIAPIEDLEVVADGASAVYGSDAISGVVNYVLRKDFNGVELNGRYSTNKYGDEWTGSVVGGTSWEGRSLFGHGNVIASYEHVRQNNVNRSELPWYRQDLRALGGLDNRINNNNATPSAAGR